MEKYCVYYDSAVDDVEYEPHNEGSWYRVEDVEPILNSLQQLKAEIAALVKAANSASDNTGSPKLPTLEAFKEYWMSQDHHHVNDLYQWFVRQLRAGA